MRMSDFYLVSPMLIIFSIPIVIMAVSILWPKRDVSLGISAAGILAALSLAVIHLHEPALQFGRFFVTDPAIRVSQIALLTACLFVIFFSRNWFLVSKENATAFSILCMISLLGGLLLIMSNHFLSFFTALELLSIPTYAMIAYQEKSRRALEASVKYILLAGFVIALLLFGIVFLYREMGTLEFEGILNELQLSPGSLPLLASIGFVLIVCGLCFKVGMVPFHMWLPDVYEGAPSHVTAYLTTVSKGAVLLFFLRFLQMIGLQAMDSMLALLSVFAVMSMLFGNIMALRQTNLKRLLAFSSIAQVGYLMIAILSQEQVANESAIFFIFAYFFAALAGFGVLCVQDSISEERENIKLLEGIFFTRPVLAICLAIALLSFTGLPLTVGFLAKLFVLKAGVNQLPMVLALVISSGIGFYAYFKVILVMANRGSTTMLPFSRAWSAAEVSVVVLAAIILCLGVWPDILLDFIYLAAFSG